MANIISCINNIQVFIKWDNKKMASVFNLSVLHEFTIVTDNRMSSKMEQFISSVRKWLQHLYTSQNVLEYLLSLSH